MARLNHDQLDALKGETQDVHLNRSMLIRETRLGNRTSAMTCEIAHQYVKGNTEEETPLALILSL